MSDRRGSVWSRRVRAVGARSVFFLSDHRWILLSLAVVLVGGVSVWVALPFVVNLLLALLAVVMLVFEFRGYLRARGEIDFPGRPSDQFRDVQASYSTDSRYEFWRMPGGSFVFDRDGSSAIRHGLVSAELMDDPYVLAPELSDFGRVFEKRRAARIDFYNGAVLGLSNDVDLGPTGGGKVRLTPATYRDHLSSDIFAMHDVVVAGRRRSEFGRRLFVDRRARLRSFESSWLLNSVGTSAIALTTDGKVVLVEQSTKNESSGGLLAPSGSGSLEPQDFGGSRVLGLAEVLAAGAMRELREEAGILETDILGYEFLGIGRWVQKAAKPEAFTLVHLGIDSDTATRREIPAEDRPFSVRKRSVRVAEPVGEPDVERVDELIEDDDVRSRLSLPLWVGVALMLRFASVD